ncbi:hypothetical protein [Nostoc sp.]
MAKESQNRLKHFAALKSKYQNEKYASTLKYKIDLGELLNESEIEWLKNNGSSVLVMPN